MPVTSWVWVLPRGEQRDARAGRRQQIDLNVAASLRRQRYLRLHVLQIVDAPAVLHRQQQRFMALGRNGPAESERKQKHKHINNGFMCAVYIAADLRLQYANEWVCMCVPGTCWTNNIVRTRKHPPTRVLSVVCAANNDACLSLCADMVHVVYGTYSTSSIQHTHKR